MRALLAGLVLVASGLAGADAARADGESLDALLARHRTCSADAQCKTLGRGARPCGGPAAWQAYSTAALTPAAERALRQQATREAEAARAAQRAEGRMGICQVLPDPGAHCSAQKRCEAGTASQ